MFFCDLVVAFDARMIVVTFVRVWLSLLNATGGCVILVTMV